LKSKIIQLIYEFSKEENENAGSRSTPNRVFRMICGMGISPCVEFFRYGMNYSSIFFPRTSLLVTQSLNAISEKNLAVNLEVGLYFWENELLSFEEMALAPNLCRQC
jgi:hypothetical protein